VRTVRVEILAGHWSAVGPPATHCTDDARVRNGAIHARRLECLVAPEVPGAVEALRHGEVDFVIGDEDARAVLAVLGVQQHRRVEGRARAAEEVEDLHVALPTSGGDEHVANVVERLWEGELRVSEGPHEPRAERSGVVARPRPNRPVRPLRLRDLDVPAPGAAAPDLARRQPLEDRLDRPARIAPLALDARVVDRPDLDRAVPSVDIHPCGVPVVGRHVTEADNHPFTNEDGVKAGRRVGP
jgi:hypothetical protein